MASGKYSELVSLCYSEMINKWRFVEVVNVRHCKVVVCRQEYGQHGTVCQQEHGEHGTVSRMGAGMKYCRSYLHD
jgi:hypothetical protein